MLKINKEIKDVDVKITTPIFQGVLNGQRQNFEAIYITCTSEELRLCIETHCSIDSIKKLKNKEKGDFSKDIIGMSYEDEFGWIYLSGDCECFIKRLSDTDYEFILKGTFEEIETYEIVFDEEFTL